MDIAMALFCVTRTSFSAIFDKKTIQQFRVRQKGVCVLFEI